MAKTTKTAKTKAKPGKAAKAPKRAPAAKMPKARKAAKAAVKAPPAKPKAAKPVSLADALAPLAGPAGKAVWQPVLTQTESPRRYLSDIKVANRFRQDKGDIAALAASIDARGALLEPIVITPDGTLVDGERRMLAWAKSKVGDYGKAPIPVSIVDIDSIIAGEYDANEQREPFKPLELVAIKRAIEAKLAGEAHGRKGHGLTAPGRKKSGDVAGKGRTADKVGEIGGISGRTLQKAEAVAEAAERDPERFGKLADDMNRTGKVDGAHKRLKIMEATDRLRAAPPPLPGNGPYVSGSMDYPWPHESDDDQASIDERGRSLRPYPAMAIEEGEAFMREQVAPLFGPDASLGFWVTNHHLVNGAAHRLIAALGPDWRASTMLTWAKDRLGRGQVLRDKTEHCIVLLRGKPVTNVLGQDPPSTLLNAQRRDNSQKPDEFYRLWERTFPAPRYASIFSTGGEGELWDGHGDQVDKHAAAPVETPAVRTDLDRLEMIADGRAAGLTIDEREELREQKLVKGAGDRATLTKAGAKRLAVLREKKLEARILAGLPDDIDGMIADYRVTLQRRHDAILGPEFQHIEGTAISGKREEIVARETKRLERLQVKANGGTNFGMSTEESPAERLRRETAAPIGQVPMWGQRGMFEVAIGDTSAIVTHDEEMQIELHSAVESPMSYINGYGRLGADGPAFCVTVDDQARSDLDEAMAWPAAGGESDSIYRMPASWDEAYSAWAGRGLHGFPSPIVVERDQPSIAPPTSRKKRGRKPAQVDIEEAIADYDRAGAHREELAREQALAVERLANLAPGEGEALADRAVAAGHLIRRTRDNGASELVATCACGAFEHRVAAGPDPDLARAAAMDAAIVDHWRAALGETASEGPKIIGYARTAPPSVDDDFPVLPEGLRRHRDPPPADNDEDTRDTGEGRHDDAA
jgi:N6-adenosine-specific RNA methylase IME4